MTISEKHEIHTKVTNRISKRCHFINKILLISCQNSFFEKLSCFRMNGMEHIAECAILILAAGHGKKNAFISLNNFDVVHGKHVIQCDGYNSTESAFGNDSADFNVCDFHGMTSL